MSYPCSKCGCCCRKIGSIVKKTGFDFPYKYDEMGKCEKLTEDNMCSVYENRPMLCNIDRMYEMFDMSKELFYALNIVACNKMMDEENIPDHFRICTKG